MKRKEKWKLVKIKLILVSTCLLFIIVAVIQISPFYISVSNYYEEKNASEQEFKQLQKGLEEYAEKSQINSKLGLNKCIDANQFELFNEKNGCILQIKLTDIIAPEIEEPYGNEASEYVCNKLTNATAVKIVYDLRKEIVVNGQNSTYVSVDGYSLNKELIEKGYAKLDYSDETVFLNKQFDEWKKAEDKAKEQKIGIWSL